MQLVRESLNETSRPSKEEIEARRQNRVATKSWRDFQAAERAKPGYVKPTYPSYPRPKGPKPSKEEADRRRYDRERKRSEKNRALAEKWIQSEDNVYYRGSADEDMLRIVLSKFNLWDSVPGNYIQLTANNNRTSDYHGSVETTNITADGNIEITSPRGAEKKVHIDQDFEKIHISSHGYDHHYYDY
jgi:hypothetical protein